jgi:hypothetical protein
MYTAQGHRQGKGVFAAKNSIVLQLQAVLFFTTMSSTHHSTCSNHVETMDVDPRTQADVDIQTQAASQDVEMSGNDSATEGGPTLQETDTDGAMEDVEHSSFMVMPREKLTPEQRRLFLECDLDLYPDTMTFEGRATFEFDDFVGILYLTEAM